MNQRIKWIDLCKGFAIVLVVLGHSYSSSNGLLTWINSFHMPLFFMISGFLFEYRERYKRTIQQVFLENIKSLLIPYYIYSILMTLFVLLLRTSGGKGFKDGFVVGMKQILLLYGNSPVWFLSCLFLAEMVLLLLHRMRKEVRFFCIIICLIIGVGLQQNTWYIVLLCRVFRAVFFLYIGELMSLADAYKPKYIIIPMVLAHVILSQWNANGSEFGKSKILFIICALLGSISVLQFFKKYINEKDLSFLDFYGKNTLTILGTHLFIVEIIRLLDYKLFGNLLYRFGILEGFVIAIIVFVIEIPVINWVNDKCPILTGKNVRRC